MSQLLPAYLLGVVVRPLLVVELLVELGDVERVDEVDERVAHIALVLKVRALPPTLKSIGR